MSYQYDVSYHVEYVKLYGNNILSQFTVPTILACYTVMQCEIAHTPVGYGQRNLMEGG